MHFETGLMDGEKAEPVYFYDGDNCVFNAVQKAASFYGAPFLTAEDKDRFQIMRERVRNITLD